MNRDTVMRLIAMLQAIPRWPQKKSTSDIARELGEHHKVHTRSVQRDLAKLSAPFSYSSEMDGRTQYWFWPPDAEVLDLPAMNLPVAMAFLLSKEYLRPLLPPAAFKLVTPHFSKAEEVLRDSPGALAAWRSRVHVARRGPRLQEVKVPEDVQVAVYEAVLAGCRLTVEYRARGAKTSKEHLLNPLGLVVYEGVSYLVATAWNYENPVTYTLHRIKSARCMPDKARRPAGFDLAAHASKEFSFPHSQETFRLVARFDAKVAQHLEERPLSSDQKIETVDGVSEVSATVADTDDLRWWLLGFGEQVEVLKPAALRAEMRERAVAMTSLYARN